MSYYIEIFKNDAFGEIRVIEIDGKPYFCAMDITRALGYKNGRDALVKHCKSDGVAKRDIIDKLNRNQSYSFVNERNLYALIMHSKLENAEKFQDWVYEEVLPSIRKHGAYMSADVIERALTDPDFLIKLATELKEEKQKRIEAELKNKELQFENDLQEHIINEQRPKVIFADAVTASEKSILVAELAKILTQNGFKIGQNRLFELLRKKGYLCHRGSYYNMPTQKAQELGLFEIKKTAITKPDGSTICSTTIKVTPKGQIYFINNFLHKEV